MVKELREKTGAGMMDCKSALTENAGDKTHNAIDYDHRRNFAAVADKVADGYLACDQMISDTLINTLIVSAQDHDILQSGYLVSHFLIEAFPIGRHEDYLIVGPL